MIRYCPPRRNMLGLRAMMAARARDPATPFLDVNFRTCYTQAYRRHAKVFLAAAVNWR